MAEPQSKFGGKYVGEEPTSQFGGTYAPESTGGEQTEEQPRTMRDFITSPHGFIREGARQIGQGAKELFTSGQRARGGTDIIRGAGSVLAPVAIGAAIPALAAAPAATLGGAALGTVGAGLGEAGGRKLVGGFGGGEEAQELGGEIGGLAGGLAGGGLGARLTPKATALIPTKEAAEPLFQRVNSAVGNVPVDVSKFAQPAINARDLQKLTKVPRPGILRGAFEQIQPTTEPLTFENARKMQSVAGQQAAQQSMAPRVMSPLMNAYRAQLAKGLAEANREVAETGGVGPIYAKAMNMWRRASQIEDAKDALRSLAVRGVKYGLPAGIGGAIGGTIAAKALGER